MSKTNQRKLQKKKKREQAKKQSAARQRMMVDFPRLTLKTDDDRVPAEFIAGVESALKVLDFKDQVLFNQADRKIYKKIKTLGFFAVLQGEDVLDRYLHHLGEKLFSVIPDKKRFDEYLLAHDVLCRPTPHDFDIILRSLEQAETSEGTVYFSPRKRTVEARGVKGTVAFTMDALRSIGSKAVLDWTTYYGAGDVFTYVRDNFYLKMTELPADEGSTAGMTLFYPVAYPFFSQVVASGIDPKYAEGDDHLYALGHCPLVFTDGYAVAGELLAPGVPGTPEHDLLMRCDLDSEEKKRLADIAAQGTTFKGSAESENFEALRWFHQNGAPQVVEKSDL